MMRALICPTAPPPASPDIIAPHNSLNYSVVSVRYKRLSYLTASSPPQFPTSAKQPCPLGIAYKSTYWLTLRSDALLEIHWPLLGTTILSKLQVTR